MFGPVVLSEWHNAVVHDEDPIHAASIDHRHVLPERSDPDAPIHLLAWVSTATAVAVVVAPGWATLKACLRSGIDPVALPGPSRT